MINLRTNIIRQLLVSLVYYKINSRPYQTSSITAVYLLSSSDVNRCIASLLSMMLATNSYVNPVFISDGSLKVEDTSFLKRVFKESVIYSQQDLLHMIAKSREIDNSKLELFATCKNIYLYKILAIIALKERNIVVIDSDVLFINSFPSFHNLFSDSRLSYYSTYSDEVKNKLDKSQHMTGFILKKTLAEQLKVKVDPYLVASFFSVRLTDLQAKLFLEKIQLIDTFQLDFKHLDEFLLSFLSNKEFALDPDKYLNLVPGISESVNTKPIFVHFAGTLKKSFWKFFIRNVLIM